MKKMLSFLSALSLTIPTATMACSFTENVQAMSTIYDINHTESTRHLIADDDNNDDIQTLEISYNNTLNDIPSIMSINYIELDFGNSRVVSDSSDAGTAHASINPTIFYLSEIMDNNGAMEFSGSANAQYSSDGVKMNVRGEILLTINGGVHIYIESEVIAYNAGSSKNTAGRGYGYLTLERMALNLN